MSTILIQGAMDVEIEYYLKQDAFKNVKPTVIHGYSFYEGNVNNNKVVVSLTKSGMHTASVATMIGINEYAPDLVINQGTAGGHSLDVHTGDIVVAKDTVNVNSLKMPFRESGIEPLDWKPFFLKYYETTDNLCEMYVEKIKGQGKKVFSGTLGSGDLYSREKDRIKWLHNTFNNLCEDMESNAVYVACETMGVAHIAIRIISNNELYNEQFEPLHAVELEKVIWEIVSKGDRFI